MTVSNVSSYYLATALLPSVNQIQSQLSNLEIESSTGQYANLGLQLGSQSGYELSLKNQDDLLASMTSANDIVSTNLSTAQNALSSILSSAQSAASSLIGSGTSGPSSSVLQNLGESNLQQLISIGNTTSNQGYIFGGENTGTTPLNDYYSQNTSLAKSSIDQAFQNYFGFITSSPQTQNITSNQLDDFISGNYSSLFDISNWQSNWSNASSTDTLQEDLTGMNITTSTNTNQIGFRELAQGYAMLSEFGDIGLNTTAVQALIKNATSIINSGIASITTTQADLGNSQSKIKDENSLINRNITNIQKQIENLDDVNQSKIATQMTLLSTQLQESYQITSKISSLSLAQYLPA